MTDIFMGGRRTGKATVMEKIMRKFTRENPQAVITEFGPGGMRIEKPVPPEYYVDQPQPEVKLLTVEYPACEYCAGTGKDGGAQCELCFGTGKELPF